MHQLVLLDAEDMEKLNNGEEVELTIGAKCDGAFFNRYDLMTAYSIVLRKHKREMKTYGDIFKEFKQKFNIQDGDVKDYRPAVELHCGQDIDGGIVVWFNDGMQIIYKTDKLYKEG